MCRSCCESLQGRRSPRGLAVMDLQNTFASRDERIPKGLFALQKSRALKDLKEGLNH